MRKTTVITGASRGIGLEFCKQYLNKNYQVYALCRTPERSEELLSLKQQDPDNLNIYPLDVTKLNTVLKFKHAIGTQPIDIILNNAGIYGDKQNIDSLDSKNWLSVFETNAIAPILFSQVFLDNVLASKDRKIVLITSKMGSITDNNSGGSYVYRSSKAALNAAGRSLAIDLREKNIQVALLHPGWVKTDMGGPNALLDTTSSVSYLIQTIDNLNIENSGSFTNYDGTIIPW